MKMEGSKVGIGLQDSRLDFVLFCGWSALEGGGLRGSISKVC